MKRMLIICVLVIASFVLSACGSDEAFGSAYTASGDSENANDLSPTSQFRGTDDLNVVVNLNQRTGDVEVEVRFFYGPQQNPWRQPISVTVEDDKGTVVLGLDFETSNEAAWPSGSWFAEVYVDGEQVETLNFTVG